MEITVANMLKYRRRAQENCTHTERTPVGVGRQLQRQVGEGLVRDALLAAHGAADGGLDLSVEQSQDQALLGLCVLVPRLLGGLQAVL